MIWLLCIFTIITYTHMEVMNLPSWYSVFFPQHHVFFFLLEGFSLYFISFLFPPKRHVLLLFLYFVSMIILWINVGYSRYFDAYMPFSLYTEFNNLNGLLPNIKDAVEKTDFIYVVCSLIVLFSYRIWGRCEKTRISILIPLLSLALLLLSFLPYFKSIQDEHIFLQKHFVELNDKRTIWDTMVNRWQKMEQTAPRPSVCYYYGVFFSNSIFFLNTIFNVERFHFSDNETKRINKYMYPESFIEYEKPFKNLVLIIVESLCSYPINKTYGDVELTPNINKLIKKAYYNPNMLSQTMYGESSDGQFIYLTGLLPLKNGVTINDIKASHITTCISLAKSNNPHVYGQMTIPTGNNAWSQELMCRKYSIDTLFSKEDYRKNFEEEWLNDKQLFELASEKDKNLKSPFMSFVLTSSMHSPYIKSFEKYNIKYPAGFSEELKHYMDNVHYMDKYLGSYIDSLEKYAWNDETVIIITADHKPNGAKLNTGDKDNFSLLPIIIYAPGRHLEKLNDSRTIAQTSLFPTILSLLHIPSKWKGVGNSLMTPDSIINSPYEKKRMNMQQTISDYIINELYLK